MRFRQACIGVFALLLGVACASTPKLLRQPTSPFVDAWLQWSDAGEPQLQVAVDVPHRQLQAPGEPGAPDLLVVTAVLLDPAGKRVTSEAWRSDLPARSTLPQEAFRRQFVLTPKRSGPHVLRLGILVRGRVLVADWQRTFAVPAFPSVQRQLSEPVFLEAASTNLVPSHVYEDVAPGRLQSSLWVPADSLVFSGTVNITWSIHQGDVEKAHGILEVTAVGGRRTQFELPLPQLPPGSYSILLAAPATDGGEASRAGGRWQVVPTIEAWADSLPAAEVLEVVLPAKTYRNLKQAPPSEQLRIWTEALQQLAPGPTAVALDLLQDRWLQASLSFVEDEVPGWQTARGRVYIRRGAPDEVESLADPYDNSRIERWRYRRDNRVFVFRDALGTGAYVLERTNDTGFP